MTLADEKLVAIALTRAAITRDYSALHDLLAGMDLDECRSACGALISLSAAAMSHLSADPVAVLDRWATETIYDAT